MKTKQQSQLLAKLLTVAGMTTVAAGLGSVAFDASAQIANTKHNLSASSNTNRVTGGATQEICVFCHTPHGADTSAPVPLWNKTINVSTTQFTTYESLGSSTIDGAFADDGVTNVLSGSKKSVGSVSLACLSCHDGTQAMDNVINAPGSGGLDATGGGAGGRSGTTWAWSGNVAADGTILNAGGSAALLSRDLRNDHPIGIQYCGGYTTAQASCKDGDFKLPTIATDGKWYVETSANGKRDKSDMILYTRTFPANGAAATSHGSVECASCHDPHVQTKASNQVAFLRVTQANSGVCLACHSK